MKAVLLGIVVLAAAVSLAGVKEAGVGPFRSGPAVILAPPVQLAQAGAAGHSLQPGVWIHVGTVGLSVSGARSTRYRLQVRLAANGRQPTGAASATGGPRLVSVRSLRDGTYRWWARFFDGSGVSRWVGFSGGTAFGVDSRPPATPAVFSPTDPLRCRASGRAANLSCAKPNLVSPVYRSSTVGFTWSDSRNRSGVAGYWYELLPATTTNLPAPHLVTTSASTAIRGVATGSYVFHVRALSRAGLWSGDGKYLLRVDSTPPTVTDVGFSTFDFNPLYNSMTINLAISRPASIRIGIYRQADNQRVRLVQIRSTAPNQIVHYIWHGRDDSGRLVGSGLYDFYVRTTDRYRNTSLREYAGLGVIYKRIVVSLSQQRLWAYDGSHLLLTSLVTTGNKALPTPKGHFTILEKRHPFTFISSAAKGAWDWYPPSPVQYAMLFQTGGYFIHDAPWRSVFGPGSNSQTGTPGQNYTGTHGCVNVPLNVARTLFYWAPSGTPVLVVS